MNKNEIKKFFNSYINTICLDEDLNPIKILDIDQVGEIIEFLIMRPGAESTQTLIPSERIIPLKGRLKERDYNYVEARFNKEWK